jgi:N-acetylglucosaminyl-diphospho-decaprenol L-rhamnosyltransferase
MLAIAIVNYRTADATIACLTSLLSESLNDVQVFVLDNGSGDDDFTRLRAFSETRNGLVHFVSSEFNLGFAAGVNLLLATILRDASIANVLLLNSDTRPVKGFFAAMIAQLNPGLRVDSVAATMIDDLDASVDNLGITLFRSTLASNRKREDERLLGPSGGCALFSRRLLEDLRESHGEWFDETFFCYAEDTDLAVRARWLGYAPGYASDAVVRHVGSLSSGGRGSDFVLYHGIRNSIWWLVKNVPLGWFLRSLPWFIALHVAIWIRHIRRGKFRVLWRLYRDAIKGIPAMRKKRAVIMKSRRVPASEFSRWVEPHFYERGYLKRAWRELFRGAPKS